MGLLIAFLIIGSWGTHLCYLLFIAEPVWTAPWIYLHLLFQTYLYTGLFITGHDAMHQSVSRIKWLNDSVGYLSVFLFAGMSYGRLIKNHWEHHRFPGSDKDPDFYVGSQNFFAWWFMFMVRYTTIWQILAMAIIFNLMEYFAGVPVPTLLIFWVLPALLATFQLFYFGTYVPHRKPHTVQMGKHRARTLKRNHLWAMVSCYFFGYHFEHHEFPGKPWWKLYQVKEHKTRDHDH